MKIKILKSGPWCLTGIGPTVHLKKDDIEPICKERIDIENAEKMIAAGWAEEISEKEATESVEVEVKQEEITESQDVKTKADQSPRRGRGRSARGRK